MGRAREEEKGEDGVEESRDETGDPLITCRDPHLPFHHRDADGDDEEEDDDDDDELAGQLADVPFEDLQRLRSEGRGGPPLSRFPARNQEAQSRRRENKNRPMEMTSKRPVPRLREVIQAPKTVNRDPRFESLCGEFDENRFKKSYAFLYDEMLPLEAEKVKKALKKQKDPHRREELQRQLKDIEKQVQAEVRRKERESTETQQKQEQKELAETGKQPFFVSKARRKREDLVEKFKELKAQGKLETFLAKKRKRNASKEHTKVPLKRRKAVSS